MRRSRGCSRSSPRASAARNFPADVRYDDASWVGHRLAELLPLPLPLKQSMLEVNDANLRLAALKQYSEREGLLQAV